ncbi:phage tail protein [Paenibacillus koleovorans]|uniref:phage tail protein n=1 Tax=Paenibacillus koleovorans TaxID=121608 RepID=UPI000FDC72B0|nr:tail fiber protein [Paenibacillus koleovorans]
MAEPFLGEIRCFSFNITPTGWAQCNGQLLKIQQYNALFTLLGNTYGGDGITTFALPNMMGRTAIHLGANGVNTRGQLGGEEMHVLTVNEMPAHTHELTGGTGASTNVATANVWGTPAASTNVSNYMSETNSQMSNNALGMAGASQGHENRQPYAVFNYCIAVQGIWPPRN